MTPKPDPYRSARPERARTLVHPRIYSWRDAVGGAAWLFALWLGFRYALDGPWQVYALIVGLLALILLIATVLAPTRNRLTLDPATSRLTISFRHHAFSRAVRTAKLDPAGALALQRVGPKRFRFVVTSESEAPVALTDTLVLDAARVRREHARLHAFLFPGRASPPLPAGSLLPACVTLELAPPPKPEPVSSPVASLALVVTLLVVGVGGFFYWGASRMTKHSATSEASRHLAAIENATNQRFKDGTVDEAGNVSHAFCPSAPQTPTAVPRGGEVTAPEQAWRAEGWTCLRFAVHAPQRYAIVYRSNYPATGASASYTVEAFGDLDGDGVLSTFRLTGEGTETGEVQRTSFRVFDEDE